MGKRILVTGAYGFIGRYISKECKIKKHYVIGMGHGKWKKNEHTEWGIDEWINCDINLEQLRKLNNIDYIIHCAGSSSVRFSLENPINDFEKSVLSIHYVLEYIRKFSVSTKLIYISSAAVYGLSENLPLNESECLNPISPYGYYKKIAEDLCKMYMQQYNLNILIVRLFSVYGNGLKKQLLWDACNKIKNNDITFWGTGKETRDWIHVKDVSRYILYILDKIDFGYDIINLGSGENISIEKILTLLFEYYGINKRPKFNNIADKGNPKDYLANIEKLNKWGLTPNISINDGIKEYIRWYRENEKN